MDKKIVIIAGPTAVGKTEYAIRAANAFNGEIVSADSMQLYKYMDIGSAKPTPAEQARAKHYLVDEIDPADPFSVSEYVILAKKYINQIFEKGMVPIISGGTGLYVNALLYDMDFSSAPGDDELRSSLRQELDLLGPQAIYDKLCQLDPEAAERIHPNNTKKVIRAIEAKLTGTGLGDFAALNRPTEDYEVLLIGLNRDREELYDRINLRVDLMLEAGLIEEIKGLMQMGLTADDISMKGIGYKELIDHLNGQYDLDTAAELIKRNSRRYAKRQLTWFRRYNEMKWIDLTGGRAAAENELFELIDEFLKG